jgi:hypothetical protein
MLPLHASEQLARDAARLQEADVTGGDPRLQRQVELAHPPCGAPAPEQGPETGGHLSHGLRLPRRVSAAITSEGMDPRASLLQNAAQEETWTTDRC